MNPSGRYPPPAAVPRWPGWPGWCWRAWLLWAMVPAALAQGECPPVARPPTAAQAQAAQRQAVDRGLLWRFSRDGRDGFLFGTIHIGRFEWAFPGPTLRSVLAASDTLALEVDLSDPEVLRQFARSAATAGSSALPLPLAVQRRLDRLADEACISRPALAQQHPVMQALTLSVMSARRMGLDAAYAQELVLGDQARLRGLRIVSLESVAEQLAALIPADAVLAQRMVEQTIEQIEAGRGPAVLLRMSRAWAEGRLAELADYEQWCECIQDEEDRQALRLLNDDRNPHLARRIETLHRGGARLLAAVGALHMTGPQSLPELLARRGFKVERIEWVKP